MSEIIEVPDTKELTELPRWARVAFAARCAQRVRPLFEIGWPDSPAEHRQALDKAIAFAADAAASAANNTTNINEVNTDVSHVANAYSVYAANVNSVIGTVRGDIVRGDADDAVLGAIAAAYFAIAAIAARNSAAGVARGASAASVAFFAADGKAHFKFLNAMRRDYDLLIACATEEEWTDDTPVPQAFFGPLWPMGDAPDWAEKEEPGGDNEIVVQIEIPDDASDAEVITAVKELADHLDTLHRAYGGHGLEVSQLDIHGEILVPEEVLQ